MTKPKDTQKPLIDRANTQKAYKLGQEPPKIAKLLSEGLEKLLQTGNQSKQQKD